MSIGIRVEVVYRWIMTIVVPFPVPIPVSLSHKHKISKAEVS